MMWCSFNCSTLEGCSHRDEFDRRTVFWGGQETDFLGRVDLLGKALQVVLKNVSHTVDAWTASVCFDTPERLPEIRSLADPFHPLLFWGSAFGRALRRLRFGPFLDRAGQFYILSSAAGDV
jgi:hypothetical protein